MLTPVQSTPILTGPFRKYDLGSGNITTEIDPINPATESQSLLAQNIWEKISPSTRKCLVENDFVFPLNLKGNYSYYNVDGHTLVIDHGTCLGKAKKEQIRFGQNLDTKEFLTFEIICKNKDQNRHIIFENEPQVVAHRNLKRFRGLISDDTDKHVYMAKALVNGVTLHEYSWSKHSGKLSDALKLAISYLEELKFIAVSDVRRPYLNDENIMIDLMSRRILLTDFWESSTFDFCKTAFLPDIMYPFINMTDLAIIRRILPNPLKLKSKEITNEKYEKFYSFLSVEGMKQNLIKKHEMNDNYFEMPISELKRELNKFLRSLESRQKQIDELKKYIEISM